MKGKAAYILLALGCAVLALLTSRYQRGHRSLGVVGVAGLPYEVDAGLVLTARAGPVKGKVYDPRNQTVKVGVTMRNVSTQERTVMLSADPSRGFYIFAADVNGKAVRVFPGSVGEEEAMFMTLKPGESHSVEAEFPASLFKRIRGSCSSWPSFIHSAHMIRGGSDCGDFAAQPLRQMVSVDPKEILRRCSNWIERRRSEKSVPWRHYHCGMRNAECGMRNAECGMKNQRFAYGTGIVEAQESR